MPIYVWPPTAFWIVVAALAVGVMGIFRALQRL
jgi:hypothetical protein